MVAGKIIRLKKMISLRNLKIWNGHQSIPENSIDIEGRLISNIGTDLPVTQESIDCSGMTAIPGLIDAHVHLELNPDDQKAPDKPHPNLPSLMEERAKKMVMAGITTARDLGGGTWQEFSLRDSINTGLKLGPRLLCSGQPITSPGGHCHFWGGEASNITEAKQVLKRQVERNADLIKIMATGGRLTKGSSPTNPQFSLELISEIVQIAHAELLPVAAHCHGTEGIYRAASAGVDTIEHCSWVGEAGWASDFQLDVAKLIKENNCRVSPTVNKGWSRMLDESRKKTLTNLRTGYQEMQRLEIPMIASTDAGIPGVYHEDLPDALAVFAQIAELSPEQALKSATSTSANALGISVSTGSLENGKFADLLIVDGDPLQDLSAIKSIFKVYASGRDVMRLS